MNRSVFWRLVWKEYRVQRSFFLAMAALAVAGELAVRWTSGLEGDRLTLWVFGVGLGLAAFYGLGVGATLFATEHETGTYEFQRSLPVDAAAILGAKTTFATASTVAMLVLAWLSAWAVAGGQLPEPVTHKQLWGLWGVGAAEMLVWGVLFSLRLRQPLVAVILAVTCASTCVHVLAGPTQGRSELAPYLAAVPARLLVAAVVAGVCTLWGLRWLKEPRWTGGRALGMRSGAESRSVLRGAGGLAMLGRLMWQQGRQSAGLIAAFALMTAAGTVSLAQASSWHGPGPMGTAIPAWWAAAGVLGIAALCLAAPLAGATVFFADQSGHAFRFLSHRGVHPHAIWFSRHLLWGTLVAVGTAAVLGVAVVRGLAHREPLGPALMAAGFVALAYTAGQFCSMFLHSGILAAVASVVLTAALCAWAALADFLNLSWLWSVAPLPLAFLLGSWLWSPHWLLERSGWRPRALACLPIIVVIAGILIAVPMVRVLQIPKVTPQIDVAALTAPPTPEAQATVELYREAFRALRLWPPQDANDRVEISEALGPAPSPEEEQKQPPSPDHLSPQKAAYLAGNQEALRLTMEACQRTECDFRTDPALPGKLPFNPQPLFELLLLQAKKLEQEGRLEQALEYHIAALRMTVHWRRGTADYWLPDSLESRALERLWAWAVRPGQKSQNVAQAVDAVAQVLGAAPPRSESLARDYLFKTRLVQADPALLATERLDPHTVWQLTFLGRWLPWERVRAIRLLDWRTARALEAVRSAEQRLAQGQPIMQDVQPQVYHDREAEIDWQLARSTLASQIGPSLPYSPYSAVERLALTETRRRATLICLALVAWRLEHGRLPDKLDRLVGAYFTRLPTDPFTGKSFEYFPEGSPFALRWEEPRAIAEQRLAPNTPFVWSAGYSALEATGASPYRQARQGWSRPPTAEQEVWLAGWVFPVPGPKQNAGDRSVTGEHSVDEKPPHKPIGEKPGVQAPDTNRPHTLAPDQGPKSQ